MGKEVKKCQQRECPAWASWGAWSGCDKSCGNGKQIRSRKCNGSRIGSRACPARDAQETQPCGGFPCARWAKWNSWSPCADTCGDSQQVRVRTCIFGQIGDPGCDVNDAKQLQKCKLAECAQQLWGSWAEWTRCTASCGGGRQMRQRPCLDVANCKTSDGIEQRFCNTDNCKLSISIPEWADWANWSPCSKSCGSGTRSRSRSCKNGYIGSGNCVTGGNQEQEPCSTQECSGGQGCHAPAQYTFKACKDRQRKTVKVSNGYLPHGTACGSILCSKSFFGYGWKAKTAKAVCECNNGSCAWSKDIHKCPTGCTMPDQWKGDRCTKQMSPKKNKFLLSNDFNSLKDKIMYTPKASKCKFISCADNPDNTVKAPRCNCDAKGQCAWSKVVNC